MACKEENDQEKADNNSIITKCPETVFREKGDKCLDGDNGHDKTHQVSQRQELNVVCGQHFGVLFPGIPETFGKSTGKRWHGKEKRKFCGSFPGQLLLHPADNGRRTAAETGKNDRQQLENPDDQRVLIRDILFLSITGLLNQPSTNNSRIPPRNITTARNIGVSSTWSMCFLSSNPTTTAGIKATSSFR